MRTKVMILHSGEKIVLYQNEQTGHWSSVREEALDMFHKKVIHGEGTKAATIRRFYSQCKNNITRKKIRDMVNESDAKFDLLFDTIKNRG